LPDPSGLHVSDLRFAYPGDSFRLHVPSLELEPGKALALAGPSGAGKSTLLRLLTGLLVTPEGQAWHGNAGYYRVGGRSVRGTVRAFTVLLRLVK
jgi:ABC-type bacteriocin/lantibiotic exporter with double-glycine peptidase domain